MGKYLAFIGVGLVLIILGIINCRGNLSSIHSYNRKRVTEEDAPKYGKCVGTGTVICGVTLLLTVLLEALTENPLVEITVLVGFAVGLIFILYGQFKYNKGLF